MIQHQSPYRIFFFTSGLICTLAFFMAAATAGPRLEVSPKQINFGEHGHNEHPEEVIQIRNLGDKPLLVEKIEVSCDCIQVIPKTIGQLLPGQTQSLRVSMGSGRAMGRLDKKITLTSNDPGRTLSIPVTMSVFEGFEMNPSSIQLKGIYGGKAVEATVDIVRRYPTSSSFKLEVKEVAGRFGSPSKEFLKAAVSPIAKGQRLTLTLDPRHPEGRINAEILATLDGKSLVIPIAGEMFAWIFVDPTFISFNKVDPKNPQSLLQEVRLNSTDGTAFQIVKVEQQGAQGSRGEVAFTFNPSSNADKKIHAVQVQITPDVKVLPNASFYGKILITTDHPKKKQVTISYGGFFAR